MPESSRFRSLYWRIAIGFVTTLAVLLAVQTALFLWLTGRFAGSASSRTPQELADLVARDLSQALTENPELNLDDYVKERFDDISQPFVVALRDGRRVSNRPAVLPPGFMERFVLQRRLPPPGGTGGPPPREFPDGSPPPRADAPPGGVPGGLPAPEGRTRRRGGGRGGPVPNVSPIVVQGVQVGQVAVPIGRPPMAVVLSELGPTLTWSGLALLGIGATVAALVIFRPARKRLRSLEHAARALGEGRTDVRADERGGDEVSSLAQTFNRMADELKAREAALTASDDARRQLLADVSHELMTPLTAIRGYTETLAMPELRIDAQTRRRYFEIVDQETYKLEAIIGDLLDLAKLEGGGTSLAFEPVLVSDLFVRVADRHQPTLKARSITLDTDVDGGLAVLGDAQRLEQALQNVASNAIRHTPDGGRVEIRAEEDPDRVRILVRDTGPGIPPEHVSRVFDRFYKVDASRTTAGPASGSGLGLSIVRAIVERHGGGVSASNATDGGAVFEIRLPRVEPADTPHA